MARTKVEAHQCKISQPKIISTIYQQRYKYHQDLCSAKHIYQSLTPDENIVREGWQ